MELVRWLAPEYPAKQDHRGSLADAHEELLVLALGRVEQDQFQHSDRCGTLLQDSPPLHHWHQILADELVLGQRPARATCVHFWAICVGFVYHVVIQVANNLHTEAGLSPKQWTDVPYINDLASKSTFVVASPYPDYCFAHNRDRATSICSDCMLAWCVTMERW